MKLCTYCGRENAEQATHCGECGTSFVAELAGASPDRAEPPEGSSQSGKAPIFGVMSIAFVVLGVVGSCLLGPGVGGWAGLFIFLVSFFGLPVLGFVSAVVGLVRKEHPNMPALAGLLGNVVFLLTVWVMHLNRGADPFPGQVRPFGDL